MNKGNPVKIVGRKAKWKLANIEMYPLTIVTAPMGYGKTLAVHNACSQSKAKVEWYDEKQTLWYPVTQYSEPTWIILDNYHKIPDVYKYYEQLLQIVEQAIENLHIVLITRTIPLIAIEEMRIKNQCQIIDCDDLKLTSEEIKEYFESNSVEMEANEAQQIAYYVGGWPTAIYLMKENYMKYNQLNHRYNLYKVIKEGIYNIYDEGYQKLIIALAGIGPFKMSEWIHMPDYAKVLKGIEKLLEDNILKYDYKGECYRLLPIFTEFLKEELVLHAQGRLQSTCEYIAKWYLVKQDWNTAFTYLIQSGNHESILKCLQDEMRYKYEDIDLEMLANVFHKIDHQLLQNYPIACLKMIYYHLLYKDAVYAKNYMDQVEVGFRTVNAYDAPLMNRVIGELYAIRSIVASETVEEIIENVDKVEEFIPEGSIVVNVIDIIHKHSMYISYRYHITPERYQGNKREMTKVVKAHNMLSQGYSIELRYLLYAEHYLYRGEWSESKKCAYKLFYKAEMGQNYIMRLCSELILARIALAQQDEIKCQRYIKNIELYTAYSTSESLEEMRKMGLWYIKGCLTIDKDQLKERDVNNILKTCYEKKIGISSYIAYAQILMNQDEILKLEILQDVVGEYFIKKSNRFGQIYYYLFESILKLRLGNVCEAKANLKKGLGIAKEDYIILPYREHLTSLRPLLEGLQQDSMVGSHVSEILKEASSKPIVALEKSTIEENRGSTWGLTKREFQITELIKEGLTNKQIAEQLYVANVTVAKTTSNIYKKLGVSNRIEMIRKMG
ncbi:LuxR C-terminal-related transcriptional regulator [Niameybacter massiliensis]|uniref:LuxR C-terminal-related transcriptional regulator n=1 Tax=Niameybacter massiliensis TaxID=1658108 RepID=UPI0006B63859|nr:LuxR C-terminal-related transcriptional regulator [Niameybacter massiliensis]